jgi:hypothetical protein
MYFEQLKKYQVFLYKESAMDNIRGPNVFYYYKSIKIEALKTGRIVILQQRRTGEKSLACRGKWE